MLLYYQVEVVIVVNLVVVVVVIEVVVNVRVGGPHGASLRATSGPLECNVTRRNWKERKEAPCINIKPKDKISKYTFGILLL